MVRSPGAARQFVSTCCYRQAQMLSNTVRVSALAVSSSPLDARVLWAPRGARRSEWSPHCTFARPSCLHPGMATSQVTQEAIRKQGCRAISR